MLLFETMPHDDIQMVPDLSMPVSNNDVMELEDLIAHNHVEPYSQSKQAAILAGEVDSWNHGHGNPLPSTYVMKFESSNKKYTKIEQQHHDSSQPIDRDLSDDLNKFLATVGGISDKLLQQLENHDVKPSTTVLGIGTSVSVEEVRRARRLSVAATTAAKPTASRSTANGNKRTRKERLHPSAKTTTKSTPASNVGKSTVSGGKAVKASAVPMEIRSKLPVVAFDESGILPTNHRPARGRGRHIQLAAMTNQEIDAEDRARQEKNRLAARDCRLRRKGHLETLENKVAMLEKKDCDNLKTIAKLKAKLAKLTSA